MRSDFRLSVVSGIARKRVSGTGTESGAEVAIRPANGWSPKAAYLKSARRFSESGRSETLARIAAPGACWVQLDVRFPMAPRFLSRAELFADKSQVVMCVRVIWFEPDGMAQVQASRLEAADFFEDAAKIEMRQRVFWINLQGAAKIIGGLFEVAFFIAKRAAVEQSVELLGIEAQGAIVSVNCFGARLVIGVIFEGGGEPFVGVRFLLRRLGKHANAFAKLACFEIQRKLAGERLKARAAMLDEDVFSVRKDAQLR